MSKLVNLKINKIHTQSIKKCENLTVFPWNLKKHNFFVFSYLFTHSLGTYHLSLKFSFLWYALENLFKGKLFNENFLTYFGHPERLGVKMSLLPVPRR